MNVLTALNFVWVYVLPIISDITKVIMVGTYSFIKDRVDDVDILALHGLDKRNQVYMSTKEWLKTQGVGLETVSSVVIYLLIEIAVANLKKTRMKSLM